MRAIHTIVLHHSATYADQDIGAAEIDAMHRARGFPPFRRPDGREGWIGYHWVVRRMGLVEAGRPEALAGAHVRGHNTGTIGICLVGGLRRESGPNLGQDTRTQAQRRAAQDPDPVDPGPPPRGAARARPPRPRGDAVPRLRCRGLVGRSRGAACAARAACARGRARRLLAALGHDPGPADGLFGPATTAALRAFQRAAGLVPDAVAGPATWAEVIRRIPNPE